MLSIRAGQPIRGGRRAVVDRRAAVRRSRCAGSDTERRGPCRSASCSCLFTRLARFQPLRVVAREHERLVEADLSGSRSPSRPAPEGCTSSSICLSVTMCSPLTSMATSLSSHAVEHVAARGCRSTGRRSGTASPPDRAPAQPVRGTTASATTISASAMMPTSSVPTSATTCSVRRR